MYFEDIDDKEGLLRLLGEETKRRLDAGQYEVEFALVVWAVGESMALDDSEFDDLMDSTDDIFSAAWTDTVAEAEYEIGGADTVCVVEFGEGLTFLAFDRNEIRDRGHIIVGEVDPADKDSIRRQAVHELFMGAGETLGMTPSEISVDSDDTEAHVRRVMQALLGHVDLGLAVIPEGKLERYALVDAYLDEVLSNRRELGGTIQVGDADESTGMLLSELLGLDDKSIAGDLDRIETELRALREELGRGDGR
ncbi:MAG: hypothetical protein U9R51_02285 [Actinomycetota bacterium]|nr:hypothetical protein [Actinomycetota bacterium]